MLQKITLLFVIVCCITAWPALTQSDSALRQLTVTPDTAFNINATVSDDGAVVLFESSADIAAVGGEATVRSIVATVGNDPPIYKEIARSRSAVASLSHDGSIVVFASTEDLRGQNTDRNSEIFIYQNGAVEQLTQTEAGTMEARLTDGNFQPSITANGQKVAFRSNRNITGGNSDLNSEIFVFDRATSNLAQITSTVKSPGVLHAQISADGSRIAYVRVEAEKVDLYLEQITDGASRRLIENVHSSSLSQGRAISHDGQRIVYVSETGSDQTQVFLFNTEAGITRQITALPARSDDVPLNPTISTDGKRIAFATRRSVVGGNSDRSVELYVHDVPTGLTEKLTDAPAKATAEVVSSLTSDGSLVVFNFPRVISGPVSDDRLVNNSEIYTLAIPPRAAFGELEVLNGASMGKEPESIKAVAPGSIVLAKGSALADLTVQAVADNTVLPKVLAGTIVTVNDRPAELLYVSPNQLAFVLPSETPIGTAEIEVRNRDGYPAKTHIQIFPAAPGIFTKSGDGSGAAIVLDAASHAVAPLDPTDGRLRLIVFGTGVHSAADLKATVDGQELAIERRLSSREIKGLDEIHLLVPARLSGLGAGTFVLQAGGRQSNSSIITLAGSVLRDIVINELLADPPDGLSGDANRDGTRDSTEDEFIELVNTTTRDFDLAGYELQTRGLTSTNDLVRHRFAPETVFFAGTSIVVFGGGNPNADHPDFAGSQIYRASTGSLSLGNSGSIVTLRNAAGEALTFQSYGGDTGLRGDQNQSLTRSPDVTGHLVQHQLAIPGVLFSPGRRVNGEAFLPAPSVKQVVINPQSVVLQIGEEIKFSAVALDTDGAEMQGVIFFWSSSDGSVVSIQSNGVARALASGSAVISTSARGTAANGSTVIVSTPTPTPTPSVTPTPTPLASPTPMVTPSPSPVPSPSPSVSPIPVVISEFRTRGPHGASDEFVELYNYSNTAVDISGWRIRASSNAGSISTRMTINAGVVIPARGHFLAVNSPGSTSGYSGSAQGDQIYTSGLANDGGLAVTLPDNTAVDQVGLSVGSAFKEGKVLTPTASDADQSYERRPGGTLGSTQDSSDNFADFRLVTPSDPQNLNSPPTPDLGPTPAPTQSPVPTPSPSPSPSATVTPTPTPAPSPSTSPTPAVVISQIYGGGGNSGAVFQHDFIEIFNAGPVAVNLDGWSVQYSSATGTTWSATNLTAILLAPGQYYLIQQASGGSSGATLPRPDVVGTTAMAATAGKVALVNSATALSGSCPNSNAIIDLVGYGGTASCFRGSPAPAPSNTNSTQRRNGGCTNSQHNAADFLIASAIPRNSSSSQNVCQVSAVSQWPFRWLVMYEVAGLFFLTLNRSKRNR